MSRRHHGILLLFTEEIPLGWSRIKLFQHRSEREAEGKPFVEETPWYLLDGSYTAYLPLSTLSAFLLIALTYFILGDHFYTIYGGPTLDQFPNRNKTPLHTGASKFSTVFMWLVPYFSHFYQIITLHDIIKHFAWFNKTAMISM